MPRGSVTRRALALQDAGKNRGKAWKPIIDRLGFDPRTFSQGTMTLGQQGGKLTPGQGTYAAPFQPFKAPSKPPTGTYDPVLDANERATNRGLADLVMDTETGRTRDASDLALGLGEVDRQARYQTEDFARQEADIRRTTQLTGQVQAGQQRAAGIRGGGVLAAALVREENQTRAIDPINVGRTRLGENVAQQKDAMNLGYTRHGEDLTTGLVRGQREAGEFGLDTTAQRFFQAQQSGWMAPSAPGNEKKKGGVTYRVKGEGPNRTYTLPNGRQMGRQEWVNTWRARKAGRPLPPGFG